eukprot:118565_1
MAFSTAKLILPFHKLKDISSAWFWMSPLTYDGRNGNYVFLTPTTINRTYAIWKYDLDRQIITEKYEYPTELYIGDPQMYIDIDNDIIYILVEYDHLISFDLK